MTHHDPTRGDLPAELRLQLRGLRRDEAPARDLWAGISERLPPQAQPGAPPPEATSRVQRRSLAPFAAAAVLVLAIGVGWQWRDTPAPTPAPVPDHPSTLALASDAAPNLRQADAMVREYQGALRELETSPPPLDAQAELHLLDASAGEVRAALAQDPGSRFLLQRLQRIYSHRLDLTRRLAQA